ncbi:MAG: 30S ribosomal protein S6 [Vulcanimicrobiaceae bacterium]
MKVDYEVTYILRPNLEEAEVDERTTAIAELLKNNGGTVLNLEKLGKKRLAYEINDVREGVYTVMRFQSEAAASKELERQMSLNEDVMRALFIKLDKHALAAEKAAALAGPPPAPAAPVTSNA